VRKSVDWGGGEVEVVWGGRLFWGVVASGREGEKKMGGEETGVCESLNRGLA